MRLNDEETDFLFLVFRPDAHLVRCRAVRGAFSRQARDFFCSNTHKEFTEHYSDSYRYWSPSDYDLISKRLKLRCPPTISSNKHELSGPRSRNKNTPRWKLQLCERPLDILYFCLSAALLQKPGASLQGLTERQRE